ncbi:unnamed protein product [Lactuca virosa]|uniref:RNA polymerase II transcription factor B subunit 2 n=1 Tax=Lactuca virosa TaxID=75947 RepID=A0AAU9N4U2_9ASTR|nr:unnamed protein product [Lactuca virosa]
MGGRRYEARRLWRMFHVKLTSDSSRREAQANLWRGTSNFQVKELETTAAHTPVFFRNENDAHTEFYEKEKESIDRKQDDVVGLKQALKVAKDRFEENIILAEKHKTEKDENNDMKSQVGQLMNQVQEHKLQLQQHDSTVEYLQDRGVDSADLISFLLELSFHVTGEAYNMNTLDEIQRITVKDLADLGFIKLQQGRKDSWFIPTKLATNLSISLSDAPSRKQGFVVVETNFRVYAYSTSKLHCEILRLFVR